MSLYFYIFQQLEILKIAFHLSANIVYCAHHWTEFLSFMKSNIPFIPLKFVHLDSSSKKLFISPLLQGNGFILCTLVLVSLFTLRL